MLKKFVESVFIAGVLAMGCVKAYDPRQDKGVRVLEVERARSCLQEKVTIERAYLEQARYGKNLWLEVKNNLPYAISAVRFSFEIRSAGRSVPWYKGEYPLGVSGGIEPGETRQLGTSAPSITREAPDQLFVVAEMLDVADSDERPLIGDVIVIGWQREVSFRSCD